MFKWLYRLLEDRMRMRLGKYFNDFKCLPENWKSHPQSPLVREVEVIEEFDLRKSSSSMTNQ